MNKEREGGREVKNQKKSFKWGGICIKVKKKRMLHEDGRKTLVRDYVELSKRKGVLSPLSLSLSRSPLPVTLNFSLDFLISW